MSKDFTRYVSHEFKTPLAVIRSHTEAAEYSDSKEELREYLSVVISETDAVSNLPLQPPYKGQQNHLKSKLIYRVRLSEQR